MYFRRIVQNFSTGGTWTRPKSGGFPIGPAGRKAGKNLKKSERDSERNEPPTRSPTKEAPLKRGGLSKPQLRVQRGLNAKRWL